MDTNAPGEMPPSYFFGIFLLQKHRESNMSKYHHELVITKRQQRDS